MRIFSFIVILILIFSCKSEDKISGEKEKLFTLINSQQSNIDFKNEVKEDLYFNFLNYSYIYNGGGVAVGDINNDGLEDIYFTSNQNSNALYLNKGKFQFENITSKANVVDDNGWTTGVTMVDINNDGWLDIYVCKSGSLRNHNLRKNKLYINQQNNTFKESAAQYGLDHYGFSTQAYFFDMDNDGDLDVYLVNHRQDFRNNIVIDESIQKRKEDYNSDQLFRNDNGTFTNITEQAGLLNKAWGLSASIGDFNNDDLLDVFVANDFLEPDFLYINQGNGTFKDEALQYFNHISSNSMGSDLADINNDLKPDLIVLDMLAEDHIRGKENMATMSTENFLKLVDIGYHHQYMSNVLQLNNGDKTFSEIGQLSGIAKTDWSWAPLIADFDNDGFNDLFVTNGIEHDLSNQDFRNQMRANIMNRKKVTLEQAIQMMPSTKLSNYIFKNNKDLTFSNATKDWGLERKVNSNGTAYADLDNDGDLDLIVNNQSEVASVYRNNTEKNSVVISLKGSKKNSTGIGTQVFVYHGTSAQKKVLQTSRGFQSSVSQKLHFGLGDDKKIDSLRVIWPDKKEEVYFAQNSKKHILLDYKNAQGGFSKHTSKNGLFESIDPKSLGIKYQQKENLFDDYQLQLLLPQKQSEVGSPMIVGDVNSDGLDDFFVGNAKEARASLYIQQKNGTFLETNQTLFEQEKKYEDTNAIFFDADNDGDLDLYVTSGGYEIKNNSSLLQDRLYENDGKGRFKKSFQHQSN